MAMVESKSSFRMRIQFSFSHLFHLSFHFLSTYICSTCIFQGETFLPLSLSSLSIFFRMFTCDTSCFYLTQVLTSSLSPQLVRRTYFLCMRRLFSSFLPFRITYTTHNTPKMKLLAFQHDTIHSMVCEFYHFIICSRKK